MYTTTLVVAALAGAAQAHMSLYFPAPLGGAPSINKQSTKADPELNFPLGCCGSDGGPNLASPGMCRGHLDKYDTETAQVTWQPGQDAHFQLTDYSYTPSAPGGTHSGGSCQVGFSMDKGKTWKLAASYHGACPHATTNGSPEAQTFDFKVPTGMPSGDALFGWIWLNREHESFMNCAKVHIGAGGSTTGNTTPTTSNTPVSNTPTTKQPTTAQPQEPAQNEPEQSEKEQPEQKQPEGDSDSEGENDSNSEDEPNKPVPSTVHGGRQHKQDKKANIESTLDDEECDEDESASHPPVKHNTRRYEVDGSTCDCSRDEKTLTARCFCTGDELKRGNVTRKALAIHRRTFYRRVDACNWATAPTMQTSYYTKDAQCAPNAKLRQKTSDNFELMWTDATCGVVSGTSEYKLKAMQCDMY